MQNKIQIFPQHSRVERPLLMYENTINLHTLLSALNPLKKFIKIHEIPQIMSIV